MKEENFPHTRNTLHWWRWGWAGGRLWSHRGGYSNRGAESKAEIFLQRVLVPTSTHQPERHVSSPSWADAAWELRLRLQRSDPRERTGVGCVNTA